MTGFNGAVFGLYFLSMGGPVNTGLKVGLKHEALRLLPPIVVFMNYNPAKNIVHENYLRSYEETDV